MSEPGSARKVGRGRRKTARKNELTDEFASGSEALDSRDAPSFSVQEEVLVYRTEPAQVVQLKVPQLQHDNFRSIHVMGRQTSKTQLTSAGTGA